jgi:hypothetical protein
MAAIHANVEAKRGARIPDWAYRDVLFLLIDYSIRAFEVLERKLSTTEKNEVFEVFYKIGSRMGVNDLPENFNAWKKMRQDHLDHNMQHSAYTDDLFRQYRKHLGMVRFRILLEVQTLVVPNTVRELLSLRKVSFIHPLLALYKASRSLKVEWIMKSLLLPPTYKKEIRALDTY